MKQGSLKWQVALLRETIADTIISAAVSALEAEDIVLEREFEDKLKDFIMDNVRMS